MRSLTRFSLPRFTLNRSIWVDFVRRFLLLRPTTSLAAPLPFPALVATVGHDVSDVQYRQIGGPVSAEVDGHTRYYIHANTTDYSLHADPAPASGGSSSGGVVLRNITYQTMADIKAACPTNDPTSPCGLPWNKGNAWRKSTKQLMKMWSYAAFSTSIGETTTLAGAPVFTGKVRLSGAMSGGVMSGATDGAGSQGGGLAAALFYSPPDAPAGYQGWLITQGLSSFDHVDDTEDGTRDVRVVLDHRLITLEAGGTLRLFLGNLAINLVHHEPWANPVRQPFRSQLVLGGSASYQVQASLDLPTSSGLVHRPPANTTAWERGYWQ